MLQHDCRQLPESSRCEGSVLARQPVCRARSGLHQRCARQTSLVCICRTYPFACTAARTFKAGDSTHDLLVQLEKILVVMHPAILPPTIRPYFVWADIASLQKLSPELAAHMTLRAQQPDRSRNLCSTSVRDRSGRPVYRDSAVQRQCGS